jgi:glycosyltransferase involved in cell wall biosynthesis
MIDKKVLFVAYNFPPHGGAGIQRSTKFVKYLPRFGWWPLVITTTSDATLIKDYSLMHDISQNASIYRIPGFSIARLQRKAKRIRLDKIIIGLNLLLQLPDATRFWAKNTHSLLKRLIEQERPDLIYTTSGPYSSHLVGLWVKRKYMIPWLADFRDPWSTNLLVPYLPGYKALNRRLERKVLNAADRVICVSDPWLDDLRSNCDDKQDKFVTITNGYDEDDIKFLSQPTKHEKFTITHVGTFYTNRQPDRLVCAVKLLIGENRINVDKLCMIFVGKNARAKIPALDPFEAYDYVPHDELTEYYSDTDTLLLILATSPENIGNYSGKIYEYIASNRPILAIVPKSGVAQKLIEETRTGIAVDGNVEAIAAAIEQMYHQWQAGFPDWNPDWDIIRQYSRRKLTEKLAAEFDKMVAEAKP